MGESADTQTSLTRKRRTDGNMSLAYIALLLMGHDLHVLTQDSICRFLKQLNLAKKTLQGCVIFSRLSVLFYSVVITSTK